LSDIPTQLVQGARPAEREPVTSWSPPLRAAAASATPRFQPGDQVTHSTFGKGVVVESRVERDDEQVVVAFEGAGVKRIMGSYLTRRPT